MAASAGGRAGLEQLLRELPRPLAVATSGGVDSTTLAILAQRVAPDGVVVVHAVSPAVPPEATARVRRHARREGMDLRVVDAGEFADPAYLANPANRCFFCKSHLYDAIAALAPAAIVSGTNLDDLGDWRPGLKAAAALGVRHPYVEAGLDKAAVRALARALDLDDLAELPAAPCLSSRIETGTAVDARLLGLVHRVERFVRRVARPDTVRCRVRASGLVVELDRASLERLDQRGREGITRAVARLASRRALAPEVSFAPYRTGSAFLRGEAGLHD